MTDPEVQVVERPNGQANAYDSTTQQRDEFGATSIAKRTETSSIALAEQAKAIVQARYIMAERRPRDWENVRVRLMRECKRPGFAEAARYSKPVGGTKIEGPSIRFAEAALRCMGNAMPETMIIYEDDQKRITRVSVTDLESNLVFSSDVSVEKTVERKFLKSGQVPLSSRKNSYGDTVYLLPATEDEIANKVAAAVSKAMRGHSLRILPGDILDECMDECVKTSNDRAAQDPDAARKKLVDAFAGLSVMPTQLQEYLGHPIDQCSPAELTDLRAVYQAIRDGEATWSETLSNKGGKDKPKPKSNGAKEKVAQATREREPGED